MLYKKEGYASSSRCSPACAQGHRSVFRPRGRQTQARSAYNVTAATHADTGGYGVSETIRQTADQGIPIAAGGGEMAEASEQGQGEGAKVKTIVRAQAKVGRNDDCPCGSGKKYKKCCGVHAA